MVKDIPLIIPNYNQFSYTRNLVNQFNFYYPENPVYIIDNGSTYKPLFDWYWKNPDFILHKYPQNDFIGNLNDFLSKIGHEYYVISDPDISIHPATPFNFLEIFKAIIDSGVHHVGFDLIYDDIPERNPKKLWIASDEKALHNSIFTFNHNGNIYVGYRAPLDTTFTMFKKGGWSAPMKPEAWDNSIRMFKAFHLSWYLDQNNLNPEMDNYFKTCLTRDDSKPSAGRNHFYAGGIR